MENFGKFMMVLIALILSPIINGFILMKFWAWFLIPTFHLDPLRLMEAIGLILIFSLVKAKTFNRDKNTWDDFIHVMVGVVVYDGLALFIGWIVSLFM